MSSSDRCTGTRPEKVPDLVGSDRSPQDAIREQVRQARTGSDGGANGRDAELLHPRKAALENQQRKLLRLHYLDAISEDLYLEEQKRISDELARLQAEEPEEVAPDTTEQDFELLVAAITAVDLDHAFDLATENERRILIDELIESVNIGLQCEALRLDSGPNPLRGSGTQGLGVCWCRRGDTCDNSTSREQLDLHCIGRFSRPSPSSVIVPGVSIVYQSSSTLPRITEMS